MKLANIFAKGRTIYLFLREGDNLEVREVNDFYPYFYVLDEKGEFFSIFGDRLKKIIVEHPGDVKRMRENFEKTFEADVTYVNRFLIDRIDKIDEFEPKIHFIDIEVVSNSFVSAKEPVAPIGLITVYDTYFQSYFSFYYSDKKFSSENTLFFNREEDLLEAWILFEKKNFPDIIVAWNGDRYDFPYLFSRAREIERISPLREAGYDGFRYFIAGCSLVDFLTLYRSITQRKKENYSLGYIGKIELGLEKLGSRLDFLELWKKDPEFLLDYNRRDVEILVKLEKKLKLLSYLNRLRCIVKGTFSDLSQNSRMVDLALLDFAKKKSIVLPTKHELSRSTTYEGALVRCEKSGVFVGVLVLDAEAMYPSIIENFNISPETISSDGKIKIGELRFTDKKKGLFPTVISYFKNERKKMKEKMKEATSEEEYRALDEKQFAFKTIVNSLYGLFGFPGSRFYDIRLAAAVTYLGRELIKKVKEIVEEKGFSVIYYDTDGIYIATDKENLEEILELGEKLRLEINKEISSFVSEFGVKNSSLSFKLEKIYRRIFFPGVKKRYAGLVVWKNGRICPDGDLDLVGFEAIRSDTPEILRVFQKDILDLLLRGEEKEKILERVEDFLLSLQKVNKIEWGFPVGVSKSVDTYKGNPIHIRAVRYSNRNFNMGIEEGDQIKYYFVKTLDPSLERTDVLAIKEGFEDILDRFELDYNEIKRRIFLKLDPLLTYLGVKKEKTEFVKTL